MNKTLPLSFALILLTFFFYTQAYADNDSFPGSPARLSANKYAGIPTVFSDTQDAGIISPSSRSSSQQVVVSETQDIPDVILYGLDSYAIEGYERAVSRWVMGGPLQDSPDTTQVLKLLQSVHERYGDFQSYQVLAIQAISDRSKSVVLELRYVKGPMYIKFLCYRTTGDDARWVVSGRLVLQTGPEGLMKDSNK